MGRIGEGGGLWADGSLNVIFNTTHPTPFIFDFCGLVGCIHFVAMCRRDVKVRGQRFYFFDALLRGDALVVQNAAMNFGLGLGDAMCVTVQRAHSTSVT